MIAERTLVGKDQNNGGAVAGPMYRLTPQTALIRYHRLSGTLWGSLQLGTRVNIWWFFPGNEPAVLRRAGPGSTR